ncbi:MAG: hypothetical protein JNL88_07520 [Bacteroidia bacterium]|nr:hypothetical protein [Bacteroidia bacterium]
MKTGETFAEFKSIADKLVKDIQEEWKDIKTKWAPAEEEAIQRFEELKNNFKTTLNALDKEMQNWKNSNRQELDAVKEKIDHLYVQLNLGKAEGMQSFEEQKQKITTEWNAFKLKLEQMPEYQTMQNKLKEELIDWRIKLDMMKVQFALGKMEVKDSWKNISEELGKEAGHLGKAVEAGAGIAGEKLDQFEGEIKKIFDKFKK